LFGQSSAIPGPHALTVAHMTWSAVIVKVCTYNNKLNI